MYRPVSHYEDTASPPRAKLACLAVLPLRARCGVFSYHLSKRYQAWKAPFPRLESRLSKGGAVPFQRRSVCPSLLLRAPCLWWSCLVVEWRRGWDRASLRTMLDVCSPICVRVGLRSWGEDAYVGDFYYLCSKEMIKRGGDRASSLCIHPYHLRDAL